MNLDLSAAHRDYQELIPLLLDELLGRYPKACLKLLRVGPPRRPNDMSMAFYDEDPQEIRLNAYWFARSVTVLRAAAVSEPLFHGPMIDEPRHVITHEMFHAIQRSISGIGPRMQRAWVESTKHPKLMPADYGLRDPVEHFAELGALVDMGLANEDQRAMLSWVIGG